MINKMFGLSAALSLVANAVRKTESKNDRWSLFINPILKAFRI
jgi:hypothetical protein